MITILGHIRIAGFELNYSSNCNFTLYLIFNIILVYYTILIVLNKTSFKQVDLGDNGYNNELLLRS